MCQQFLQTPYILSPSSFTSQQPLGQSARARMSSFPSLISTFLLLHLFIQTSSIKAAAERSFNIDFPNNQFLRDGQAFRYISGSIHYFRIPPYYWRDRLLKMRAAGLNALEFYIPWNLHEPIPGKYHFSGIANLTKFLDIAHELGFVINMRMGPYVCGEWENGGLPWWLLKTHDIRMRTSDPRFLKPVKKWYDKLFPILLPYLYKNGGPIALMQVENEYGSRVWCDIVYKAFLRDLFRSYVGYDFLLVTVDGGALSYLKCGFIPDVYPTVDYGVSSPKGVASAFAAQRTYAPRGPLINSEFYPGWLDNWGSKFATVRTAPILATMTYMYQMGASFNFYMFMGGTNFGYMNGGDSSVPVTTTYDYDAPLTEAGDPTPKYFAIREHIRNLTGWHLPSHVLPATRKTRYGRVQLKQLGSVLDLLNAVSPRNKQLHSILPMSMEDMNFPYGYVVYETTITHMGTTLRTPFPKDRGYVMLDGQPKGTLIYKFKSVQKHSLPINAKPGQKLQILIENRGRQNSGFNDPKGLLPNVTLDGIVLTNWTMYPIQLENIFSAQKRRKAKYFVSMRRNRPEFFDQGYIPSIYYGRFSTDEPMDTFFNPTGWSKGQFFINKHNVGRYWPSMGPQVTLYTPMPMMKSGPNHVVLLELESPGNCEDATNKTCWVSFTDKPYLDKPINGTKEDVLAERPKSALMEVLASPPLKLPGFVSVNSEKEQLSPCFY